MRPPYLPLVTQSLSISIHALTRSATESACIFPSSSSHFNPRTHEECDCLFFLTASTPNLISIHALTRSATHSFRSRFRILSNFNPRTHEECDDYESTFFDFPDLFQSTHSRGVRLSLAFLHNAAFPNFNPRTHEECDAGATAFVKMGIISIHALTRSATEAAPEE